MNMMLLELLILKSIVVFSSAKCGGKKGLICCSGYTWNATLKDCTKCPPGYYGVNCTGICIYPSYGELCESTCSCKEEFCDRKKGCSNAKGGWKTFEFISAAANADLNVQMYGNSAGRDEIFLNCYKCKENITQVAHYHTNHYDALQIGMFSVTALLLFVLIISIIKKNYKRCKSHKKTKYNKDPANINPEELYEELDENECTIKQNGNFIFDGEANAKVLLDKSLKTYFIELAPLPTRFLEKSGIIQSTECLAKEELELKQESTTENGDIQPGPSLGKEMTCVTNNTAITAENVGSNNETAKFENENTYLIATNKQE